MQLKNSNYQHFSFDLWLTLIKSNPIFKKKRDHLLIDFFSINQTIEKVQATVRYYDVLCNNISENTGRHFNRDEIYFLILKKSGINIQSVCTKKMTEFSRLIEELFMQYLPELIAKDIHLTFKEIHNQGKTMNILSNTGFIHGITLRKVLEYYELSDFFSFQIYSDETGYSKPNSKMFQLVYEKANLIKKVNKKDIIHIGDNKSADYQGALDFGFQGILIKN